MVIFGGECGRLCISCALLGAVCGRVHCWVCPGVGAWIEQGVLGVFLPVMFLPGLSDLPECWIYELELWEVHASSAGLPWVLIMLANHIVSYSKGASVLACIVVLSWLCLLGFTVGTCDCHSHHHVLVSRGT